MAWIDKTALENAITSQLLIELTSDADNPTVTDETVMNAAIDLAVSQVKGKLKRMYAAQCVNETTSLDISEIVLCLTFRNLLGRRMGYPVTKEWGDRIERAVLDLENIRKGYQGVAEWTAVDSIAIEEHQFPENKNYVDWESGITECDF